MWHRSDNYTTGHKYLNTMLYQTYKYISSHSYVTCLKKPLLRAKNKQKRLQRARHHKDWTIGKWNEILWSDEFKFEIFGSKRRVFVRRFEGERASQQC